MEKLEALFAEIAELISTRVGEAGKPFTAGKFTGLGWLDFPYRTTDYDGPYPRIALKTQSDAVHVYVMSRDPDMLQEYVNVFGKTGIGKGCIRIKKLTPERQAALIEIVDNQLVTPP